MPKWVMPSIVELAEKHSSTSLLSLVIAAWIKYLQSSVDERGAPVQVVDSRSEELKRMAQSIGNDPRPFLANKSLFGSPWFAEPAFAAGVENALRSLSTFGAEETVRRYTATAK